jgi:glycerophosphoryl diester phosphodiesterase
VAADARPAISAHRGGNERARAGTYDAYRFALDVGAEYVEVDVRQTADGELVCYHRARQRPPARRANTGGRPARLCPPDMAGTPVADLTYDRLCQAAGYEVPLLVNVLPMLAGRAGLHLDVKETRSAGAAAQLAAASLGPGRVLVTTRDAAVVRCLAAARPDLGVGLAIGGDLAESLRFALRREMSRMDAIIASGASWAALHYRVAKAGLAAQCRERGVGTLVWTVNGDPALAWWLASPDVGILVTDRPARALELRAQSAPRPG